MPPRRLLRTGPSRLRVLGGAGVAVAVAAGVVLRFWARSPLWLDEALTVNIARLPLADLLERLEHDGHPPLYYLLLHGWMELFGEGDRAVRALSGVLAVATLVPAWFVGRRVGGRRCGAAMVVLLATSPFAVRYATEARMYALVMLLVVLGWLVVRGALDRPDRLRLAAVALTSGLLALTHYWAFYLLAAVLGVLLVAWRRGSRPAGRVALAVVAGGVLFLPWLPSFLVQQGSTGTPWGRPVRPTGMLAISLTDWSGGPNVEGTTLSYALLLLVLLGALAAPVRGAVVRLDLRGRPTVRREAAVVLGTLALALVVGAVTGSAFASRYTAVVLPLVLLVAAWGVAVLGPGRAAAVLVVVGVLGLAGMVRNAVTDRTQAGEIAERIEAASRAGDVVGFCPDQLGPAVNRLLPAGRRQLAFPDGGDPRFVDWQDYADRQAAGDPDAFAARLDRLAGGDAVWLVWAGGYRTLDDRCEAVVARLQQLRQGAPVVSPGDQHEPASLWHFVPR